MGPSDHEALNQPVTRLVVVSTSDKQLIYLVGQLIDSIVMPDFIDPDIHTIVLLLHDASTNADLKSILNQLKERYTAVSLVINSCVDGSEHVSDIWSAHVKESALVDTFCNKGDDYVEMLRGTLISSQDLIAAQALMAWFAESVRSHMSQQLKEWDKVANSKRGISNRLFKVGLKYFSKPGTTPTHYSSAEMLTRRAGDYAYMMGDYKYAASLYDLVKKDFTEYHYAGCLEMAALSVLMQGEIKAADQQFEMASKIYQQCDMAVYAARSAMWAAQAFKELEAFKESASALLRVNVSIVIT